SRVQGLGTIHAVHVVGTTAYVGTSSALVLIDVSDTSKPSTITSFDLPDAAQDVCVVGNVAHVAAAEAGLILVDLSDPEHLVTMAEVALPGSARQVAVSGGRAFVASESTGLHVVDLEALEGPEILLSSYDAAGAIAVAVVGDAVLTTRSDAPTLVVSDLHDPTSPAVLATGDLQSDALEPAPGLHLAVSGPRAFVAAGTGGLHIFDIATLTQPDKLGVFDDLGQAQGVRVGDGLAHVADGPGGYRVIDVSDVSAPVEIWREDPLAAPYRAVDLADGHVFLVTSEALLVRDADPNAGFSLVAQAALTDGHEVEVVGQTALVADGPGGLRVFDVGPEGLSEGQGLAEVATLDLEDTRALHVARDIAYVADGWAGLRLVDVQVPTDPFTLSAMDLADEINGVHVVGPIAYVTGGQVGLHIIDVRDPEAPAHISTRSLSGTIDGIQVVGTFGSVTVGTGGLSFLNLGALESPAGAGGVHTQTYDATLAFGASPVGEVRRHGGQATLATGVLALTTLSVPHPCDDGDPCTADVCDSVFGCSHPPDEAICFDGDPCTQDLCFGDGLCEHPGAVGVLCDDEDPTTLGDACTATAACAGTPYVCTPTQCQATAVQNGVDCDVTLPPIGTGCDDENPATLDDVCDGQGGCAGVPYTCQTGLCEVTSTPNGVDCDVVYHDGSEGCDDLDVSTRDDACDGAGGCAGTPYLCTPDQCEATSTHNGVDCDVTYQNAIHPCDDGDVATKNDTCNGIGSCYGTYITCVPTQCEATSTPDGLDCVVTFKSVIQSCDDGDLTTRFDACDGAGGCAGTPYDCESAPCVTSSVHNGEDCDITLAPEGAPCDDGDPGTESDVCGAEGQCGGLSQCPSQTLEFTVTGVAHALSVPECATTVTLEAWGGQGGFVGLPEYGGMGAYVRGTMTDLAGQTLHVRVGGAGAHEATEATPGYNGGGGHHPGSYPFTVGGGGASDVRVGGQSLAHRVLVAGGGGGSAWCNGEVMRGGHGGGFDGESGGHGDGADGAQGAGGTL
ncbi:MAG: glycine-rich protein, partial [Myxococcota bacterium]|nr:glycine-rich protein [Myxococcota bacterium]